LNKGKRSVTLNFRDPDGRRILGDPLASSGPGGAIVLTQAIRQEWPSYTELAQLAPDLIHLPIHGQHDGRAAVDYAVNAAMGFPLITNAGNKEGR
jgi:2-methylfumaryl-CoA isomerase